MAQKIEVTLVDDLDGKRADETVQFGIDGVTYEIDLSKKNAAALRGGVEPYLSAGRRVGSRKGRGAAKVVETGVDTRAVRAWARSNGIELPDRGRIAGTVIEQYRAAGN